VGLERGPLNLVTTTEELLGRKSRVSGLEKSRMWPWGSAVLTTRHPLTAKVVTNFAEKRRSFGWYSIVDLQKGDINFGRSTRSTFVSTERI
jgi:hypothetical protein